MTEITKTVHCRSQEKAAADWVQRAIAYAVKDGPICITLHRPEASRSSGANAKFHAMIDDIQRQAVITMPGRRVVMSEYDTSAVKALLVIWFAKERELNGEPLSKPPRSLIDPVSGEWVSIRPSTAQWGKRDASDFIEFLYSVGNDGGVRWSEPAIKAYEEMRESKV